VTSPHLFVSYAKADVAYVESERLGRLAKIERAAERMSMRVFIDELHNYRGGHVAVIRALDAASSFCYIDGPNYMQTTWTRWEFLRAWQSSIPIFRIQVANADVSATR
jgi:hypothetical protein